jgi:hypothetical protein
MESNGFSTVQACAKKRAAVFAVHFLHSRKRLLKKGDLQERTGCL